MMNKFKQISMAAITAAAVFSAHYAVAKTVEVTMTAKEVDVIVDGKGTTMAGWTFDGAIPGKIVRVDEGDTVDFTLINPPENKNSHAMDFHAAQVNVLDEFAPVKPGEKKHFKFEARVPGSIFSLAISSLLGLNCISAAATAVAFSLESAMCSLSVASSISSLLSPRLIWSP